MSVVGITVAPPPVTCATIVCLLRLKVKEARTSFQRTSLTRLISEGLSGFFFPNLKIQLFTYESLHSEHRCVAH